MFKFWLKFCLLHFIVSHKLFIIVAIFNFGPDFYYVENINLKGKILMALKIIYIQKSIIAS